VIIPVGALIAVLSSVALGGRLRRLAEVRIRYAWTIGAALLIQIIVIEVLTGPMWLLSGAHIATYGVAGFFLWANRRIPGLVAVAIGGASNGIAITLNGGTLPAGASALRSAGIVQTAGAFTNSGMVAHPRLAFLGDVFAIPAGWLLPNVFSIGDVLVMCGVAYASFRICGTRWTSPWSARSAGHGRPRHLAAATGRVPRIPAPRHAGERSSAVAASGVATLAAQAHPIASSPVSRVDSVHDQR
jgi:hypothetical protein